jgi:hypothetical protein
MPVLEDPSGTQHERVVLIGDLGWCNPRMEPDLSTVIVCGRMIKLNLFSSGHVGVETFCKSKMRLLPLSVRFHNRPAESSGLDVLTIRGEVFVLEASELSILFKQMLIDVGVVIVFPIPDRN